MRVIKAQSTEITSRLGDSQRFTGTVLIQDLVRGQSDKDINVYRVRFEPGARTHWHRHPGGQVLCIESGVGRIGTAGQTLEEGQQKAWEMSAGDVIWIEPGEWHWHGAEPDKDMIHIAISPALGSDAAKDHYEKDWDREVTTGEYDSIDRSS